jgi:predicted nucleic acid-binding protein
MIVLDSSVWIAFLNKKDSQHNKAEKFLESIQSKIIVPEYVILEVCSVLLAKVGKKTANLFLEIIMDNQDIEVLFSNKIFFLELVEYFKNILRKNLSFVDIALLYLSNSYEVATFDNKLKRAILNRK